MAFNRPTLQELQDRMISDVEKKFNIPPVLKRSLIAVLTKTNAGAIYLNYGYLDYIFKQLFPDTAEAEYLQRWASIWGVKRVEAAFASGQVIFTGVEDSIIQANTLMTSDDGKEYRSIQESTINSGEAIVDVIAINSGSEGNLLAGAILTLQSPLVGINVSGVVGEDGISGGKSQESDDLLRERVIKRIQNPPIGGSKSDYEQRALQISGIGKAFVKENYAGPGNVTIFILTDKNETPLPSEEKRLEVLAHLTADEWKPVPAQVSVVVPNSKAMNFNINPSPDNSRVRSSIEANLKELIYRVRAPGATIYLSQIREAISLSTGENDHQLISPSSDFVCLPGEIPVFNSITWS